MSLWKRSLQHICWFPRMSTLVNQTIEKCPPCACNEKQVIMSEPIMPTAFPPSSWHTLAIDFSSRTPTGEYTLAVYDEHSRKTLVKLSKDLTSAAAIAICKNYFAKYGIPEIIKSDNGPAFISNEWTQFSKKYNFIHKKITPLHPKANAGAERVMKSTNKQIRCSKVAGTPWKAWNGKCRCSLKDTTKRLTQQLDTHPTYYF